MASIAQLWRRALDRLRRPPSGWEPGIRSENQLMTRGAAPTIAPSAGQSGPDATVQVDPHGVGAVRMSYRPHPDADPDPGEVVWTWVPFEEDDGRGKDRPVLVVATEADRSDGCVLAVELTSKAHPDRPEYLPVGAGAWDGEHRPSFVKLDRLFRVHPGGMRREGAALDHDAFGTVESELCRRYGWTAEAVD